jgi:cytidylate kinase
VSGLNGAHDANGAAGADGGDGVGARAAAARRRVVAIDGPSGSGKSTTARTVAERLGLAVLDTGAMFRAVTFAALRSGVSVGDEDAVATLACRLDLDVGPPVVVDGVDATAEIRTPEVTAAVSTVAANPRVRRELADRQRAWVDAHGGGVVEGRDIGTVVFPEAAVKVYLVARSDVRARRRQRDERAAARAADVAALQESMARRDHADSTRAAAPLTQAPDALVIDTSGRSVDEVVDLIVDRWTEPDESEAEQAR